MPQSGDPARGLRGKVVKPSQRQEMAKSAVNRHCVCRDRFSVDVTVYLEISSFIAAFCKAISA
jgi:hypothetical protein